MSSIESMQSQAGCEESTFMADATSFLQNEGDILSEADYDEAATRILEEYLEAIHNILVTRDDAGYGFSFMLGTRTRTDGDVNPDPTVTGVFSQRRSTILS